MSNNKLKVQGFRTNDLADDTGKQFELGKSWCEFFEIDNSLNEVSFLLTFKPIIKEHSLFANKQIELKLSEPTGRGDRKAYANGNHGFSAIKDFFIYDLELTSENNSEDYFAVYKFSELDYFLYYIPKLLHDNFIKWFESVTPTVSIHRNQASKTLKPTSGLQRIYYGAPGTGKSFEINRQTKDKEVIRTTFHPDSDYSTFVGAYKPTSIEVPIRDVTGKIIIEDRQKVTENRIVYEFVEQAFLQAYTKAWLAYTEIEVGAKANEQYLVIEEINRGNCAQIFGDLFQLLDRNYAGFSDYPISADKDLKKQLAKVFEGKTIKDAERINKIYGKDIVSKVLSGDVLLLPDNLFIWATMNTSDQSLFPIDSAFKRRWDWKYIPISEGKTEMGDSVGYRIQVNGKIYDWWTFVQRINDEIEEQTKSEDKKLGYFFCKTDDGIIEEETFVSKVVFYLWNDVFKDQDVASIFNDGEEELTFNNFYDVDDYGRPIVRKEKVEVILNNLKMEPIDEVRPPFYGDDKFTGDSHLRVSFPDGTIIEYNNSSDTLVKFVELVEPQRIVDLKIRQSKDQELVTKENIVEKQAKAVGDTGYYVITKLSIAEIKVRIEDISEDLELNCKVQKIRRKDN